MSVQQGTEERASVDFIRQDDVPFGALMDALVADDTEEGGQEAPGGPSGGREGEAGPDVQSGASGAPGGPDAPGGGPAADGRPGGGAAPGAAADGGAGGGADSGGAGQPAATGQPAADEPAGSVDVSAVAPKIGELSTAFEERITKGYQQMAYETAREEYGNYFDALEKHPRLLVGVEVPAIGKEGMEVLRSSEDAREWQEAVRSLLVEEIRATAQKKMEESSDFIETIHASIDLFKNNVDLIPGTKGFNRALADQFAAMAQPYEIRDEDDNKLLGYSIPVQPIIDQIRNQLKAQQAPPPQSAQKAPPIKPKPDPPQAGITSKSGNSSEREDFSTLFGTIGLPNLQI